MNEILLTGVNLKQLLEEIGQLVENKVRYVFSSTLSTEKEFKYITRQHVAKLLKITLPTLNEWTKLGWLQSYKIGSRVLYKKEEVISSVDKLATFKFKKGGRNEA